MGYDYHHPGSQPGASAPLASDELLGPSLDASLALYQALGVPADRTILGLPLYGVSWPVASPAPGAPRTGSGSTWIPSRNPDLLTDSGLAPSYDAIASVEFVAVPTGTTWRAIYFDSPRSLEPKLALAERAGLAGAGFWAIGYTDGLDGYGQLVARYRAGSIAPS